jgi:hypothetical protein
MQTSTAIPLFPEFAPLSRRHGFAIGNYARQFAPYSDYTFLSLWSWDVFNQIELSSLNGNLVVRFTDYLAGDKFLSFLGNRKTGETLEAVFELLDSRPDHLKKLRLIPESSIDSVTLPSDYQVAEDADNHDYIYSVDEWSLFPGKKFGRLRQKMQHFISAHECRDCALDFDDAAVWREIRSLCQKWKSQKSEKRDVLNDIAALNRLSELGGNKSLCGVGLYVDRELAAYCIAELVHDRFACGLFEHVDTTYAGITPYLRNRLALHLKEKGCDWLNFQQDLGLDGLRTCKRRYRPAYFLRKFVIERAGRNGREV